MNPNAKYLSAVAKGDMALTDLVNNGGLLVPEQALEFWRINVLSSNFQQLCTIKELKNNQYEIPKIAGDGWTLSPGLERTAVAEADRFKPVTSKVTLVGKELKVDCSIPYRVAEENVERGAFLQTVQALIGEAISRDLSTCLVQGDTSLVGSATDAKSRSLALFDGIIKQATSNIVDAAGARCSPTVLSKCYRALPAQFRDKSTLQFLTSPNAQDDYYTSLQSRVTELGDRAVTDAEDVKYRTMPVLGLTCFPENLTGSQDRTDIILCDPKGIFLGFGQDVTFEFDRNIRASEWIIVARVKVDVKYRHEPSVVRAHDVLASA